MSTRELRQNEDEDDDENEHSSEEEGQEADYGGHTAGEWAKGVLDLIGPICMTFFGLTGGNCSGIPSIKAMIVCFAAVTLFTNLLKCNFNLDRKDAAIERKTTFQAAQMLALFQCILGIWGMVITFPNSNQLFVDSGGELGCTLQVYLNAFIPSAIIFVILVVMAARGLCTLVCGSKSEEDMGDSDAHEKLEAKWSANDVALDYARWSPRERDLFNLSHGKFHPDQMAAALRRVSKSKQAGVPGRVSVCVPTMGCRKEFHEHLWKIFDAQDWADKELVVVETYQHSPSPFFTNKSKEDKRLIYMSFKLPIAQDFSIGLKRNMCTHLASGEILANFDDDDIYAPMYISTMVNAMKEAKATAATLSSWYTYDIARQKVGFYDPQAYFGKAYCVDSLLYGYGFSYIYFREAAIQIPYPDQNFGEDYEFFCALRTFPGQSIVLVPDKVTGICFHTTHPDSTSSCEEVIHLSTGESERLKVFHFAQEFLQARRLKWIDDQQKELEEGCCSFFL
eukprot:gnl/MRDRNA2_/MRDRNA2_159567_c0_seq1.p1 gnl/MRDRNA2_/MRDRNA2_159567_c0~~gnl/MRDRNA2_/MRDRNA2_159567_c0_seq1.p1  ORF type:complete len:540 (-),score=79.48 gnl/MRDRNA2_/MRDRNA2_159567_c0_seq1:165-1688(-)